MTRRVSKSGFTLLEVLVASMLLGMLITILTMVFNSSSIAWSTGKASVVDMNKARNTMATAGIVADNAVPGVDKGNTWGLLVGPWNADGSIRQRAVEAIAGNELFSGTGMDLPSVQRKGSWAYDNGRIWSTLVPPDGSEPSAKPKDFVVGVWSLGPDGKEDTGDDISTWPDDM